MVLASLCGGRWAPSPGGHLYSAYGEVVRHSATLETPTAECDQEVDEMEELAEAEAAARAAAREEVEAAVRAARAAAAARADARAARLKALDRVRLERDKQREAATVARVEAPPVVRHNQTHFIQVSDTWPSKRGTMTTGACVWLARGRSHASRS